MTSKPTNAETLNYLSYDEMEEMYQHDQLIRRKTNLFWDCMIIGGLTLVTLACLYLTGLAIVPLIFGMVLSALLSGMTVLAAYHAYDNWRYM